MINCTVPLHDESGTSPCARSHSNNLPSCSASDTSDPPSHEVEAAESRSKKIDAATSFLSSLSNYLPVGSLFLCVMGKTFPHRQDQWQELHTQELDFLEASQSVQALVRNRWIRVFLGALSTHGRACLRIYVLPDDIGRKYVERGDRMLRKHLMSLIAKLDTSSEAWTCQATLAMLQNSVEVPKSMIPYHGMTNHEILRPKEIRNTGDGQESLFYLFNTLPSPNPNLADITCAASRQAMSAVLDSSNLLGLRTCLYPYQRRTVATMLQREMQPAKGLDPRLELLRTPTKDTFYYDRQKGLLFRDKKEYDETRGGVLAESMGFSKGLGKTLICLSMVSATKGHWPSVPPEFSLGRHPVRPRTASLMQMAAAAVGREQVPWRSVFQNIALEGEEHQNCIRLLEDNIGSYVIPPAITRHSKRASTEEQGRMIRLSNITLIIVPQNLLSQWKKEIEIHFEGGSFETLFLESNDSSVPSIQMLLKYDIIIMTRSKLEREIFPAGAPTRPNSRGGCRCSLDKDCDCSSSIEYHSPLRDMHFLRIIMDEGHEFSSGKKTLTYWALSKIHVDRKWLVSGTPTCGLMGVEVETAAHETTDESGAGPRSSETLAARRQEPSFVQEMKDLEALRVMVVGFLKLTPWANSRGNDPASWAQYIMPYKDGRRKPASLKTLLQSLIVRHRIEEIEADVTLPSLHNRVVYLEPSWHDKISINLFILTLISNAVTSERSDEDYMFDAKNRQALHQLVNNLRQTGFYWTSFTQEDVSRTLEVSRQYLESHPLTSAGRAGRDFALLKNAVSTGEIILASPSWKALSSLHEMGIFADGFPEACDSAWSLVSRQRDEPMLMGATQLVEVQRWVYSHSFLGADSLEQGLESLGTKTLRKLWQEAHGVEEMITAGSLLESRNQQAPKKRRLAHSSAPRLTERLTVSRARPAHTARGAEGTKAQTGDLPAEHKLKSAMKTTCRIPMKPFQADSTIMRSTLHGTASAKLSYLLDRVITLYKEEKILIFYEGDQIAYYIAQAFEILDIRFLIYTRTLDLALKNAYVATFNATSTFRVMLMNIHEAAHGLHIASASRVFFVNPIWQPHVEAQAIKRAHRIGQTRPVYVETLVLKDTLEDQMLRRRKGMTAQEHLKAEKSLLDDDTMSAMIENAQLIPLSEDELHVISAQVAKLQSPQRLFGQPNAGTGGSDAEDPYADLIFPVETPKAIRKSRKRLSRSTNTQVLPKNGLKRKSEVDLFPNYAESPTPTKMRVEGSASTYAAYSPSAAPCGSAETFKLRPKRVGFALDDGEEEAASLLDSNVASASSVRTASASSKKVNILFDQGKASYG